MVEFIVVVRADTLLLLRAKHCGRAPPSAVRSSSPTIVGFGFGERPEAGRRADSFRFDCTPFGDRGGVFDLPRDGQCGGGFSPG